MQGTSFFIYCYIDIIVHKLFTHVCTKKLPFFPSDPYGISLHIICVQEPGFPEDTFLEVQ